MRNIRLIYKFTIVLLTSVVFGIIMSCTDKDPVMMTINSNQAKIRFTVETPGSVSRTRTQTEDENRISEIDILVFEDNYYRYRAIGIENNGTYEAQIRSSSSRVDLYILANATNIISGHDLQTGMSFDDVKRTLTDNVTETGLFSPFVMCGKASITEGIGANTTKTINNIQLIRAIARADVALSPEVDGYKLTSIQAFRMSNRYQLLPNQTNEYGIVTYPSIPLSTTRSIDTDQFTQTNTNGGLTMYLPEVRAISGSAGTTRDVCLVVGVNNQNNLESFYRISFADDNDRSISILRNHRYSFNVIEINGNGTSTPEEAAGDITTNIRVKVTMWEESRTSTNIKGEEYFSVSARKLNMGFRKNKERSITVNTNIGDYGIQWSNESGEAISNTFLQEIDNENFTVTINSNNSITVMTKNDNTGITDLTDYFVIKASDWIIPMQISQGTPEGQRNQYINFLSFGTGIGSLGGGLIPYRSNSGNASGFRNLLLNTANFGPSGIVPLKFIGLDYTSGSNNYDEFRRYLEQFDVINLSYSAGTSRSDIQYQAIKDWQAYKKGRVIIITKDGSNYMHFDEIVGTVSNLWLSSGTNEWQMFGGNDNPVYNYFVNYGPFGTVDGNTKFDIADSVWMGMDINHDFVKDLISILKDINNERVTVAFDPKRNILYIGDSSLYQGRSGAITTSGNTDYDQGRLMANIFAYLIEEIIMPAKLNPYE